MILAVDTSLGTAVALTTPDGVLLAEASVPGALGHAEVIGDLLARVAASAEVSHVAIGMGPGPFTGLRIGIAAARAFALGRAIPTIPVPSHFAAALAHVEAGAAGGFAVVTDARRREVAVSVFDGLDDDLLPRQTLPTVLVPRVTLEEHLAGTPSVEVAELEASCLARVGARALAAGRVLTGGEALYLRQPDVVVPGAPKRVSA